MMNKLIKKIVLVLTVAILTLTAVTPVFANEEANIAAYSVNTVSGVKTVIADTAIIRAEPIEEGRILKRVTYGTTISFCGITDNGWYQLYVLDNAYGVEIAGYIDGSLLADVENLTYATHVDQGYLALRSYAGYDEYNEIGPLWNGSSVTIIGNRIGDYVPVRVNYSAPGQYGYNIAGYTGYVDVNCLC